MNSCKKTSLLFAHFAICILIISCNNHKDAMVYEHSRNDRPTMYYVSLNSYIFFISKKDILNIIYIKNVINSSSHFQANIC